MIAISVEIKKSRYARTQGILVHVRLGNKYLPKPREDEQLGIKLV
jgi:hypothetical protein